MDNSGRNFLIIKFCNVCGFFQSIGHWGHNFNEASSNYLMSNTRLIIMPNDINVEGIGIEYVQIIH
jgi:hypothetical protein